MTKTITFAVMHFSIAFTVAYLITGSFIVGGLVAIVEPAINTVAFYFHEVFWNKFQKLKEAKGPNAQSFYSDAEAAITKTFQSAGESYALRSM
ncbi:DUF2061 domain-containing protein [Marinomonas sp. 2405UD66-6]|uniref:DUF2061 domain-containing protein n=1 Tax=Marinomonas sp. 2405UD66-6 TaxID=3391834 RepID=UPI0039C8D2F8